MSNEQLKDVKREPPAKADEPKTEAKAAKKAKDADG
jgi:hypothetical protein